MADFLWIPCPDDKKGHWDDFATSLSAKYGKFILRSPGDPEIKSRQGGRVGTWSEIADNDSLIIPAHGILTNTNMIGWVGKKTGVVKWTYQELVYNICMRLSTAQKQFSITYRLWACWAGDNWMGRESFGGKFSSAMGAVGMKGTVIAYKGKVTIGATKRLVVKGSGRFSSWFGDAKSAGALNQATHQTAAGGYTVDERNYYDEDEVKVTWPIPAGG